MTGRHLTDNEIAERVGKSKWFVQEQCKRNGWPHLRVGKSYRFTAEHVAAIDALLERKTQPAAPAANPWGRKARGA